MPLEFVFNVFFPLYCKHSSLQQQNKLQIFYIHRQSRKACQKEHLEKLWKENQQEGIWGAKKGNNIDNMPFYTNSVSR